LVVLLVLLWIVNRDTAASPAATTTQASASQQPSGQGSGLPSELGVVKTSASVVVPAVYRVSNDLCPAIEYAPIAATVGQAAGEAFGDHEDKAEFTAFTCDRRFASGTVTVTALIFQSGPLAAAHVANLPSPSAAAAQFWYQDGNLVLGVRLKTAGGTAPPAAWRAAAGDLAKATMPKLKV
jgi:hypothetical protein